VLTAELNEVLGQLEEKQAEVELLTHNVAEVEKTLGREVTSTKVQKKKVVDRLTGKVREKDQEIEQLEKRIEELAEWE